MNHLEFEVILKRAMKKTEYRMVERPDLQPLISIKKQLEYLIKLNDGLSDGSRLKYISLGLLAVREIENWDDDLADLLHEISAEVRILIKTDKLSRSWS